MDIKAVVKLGAATLVGVFAWHALSYAERVADIQNTKHNFSALRNDALPTGQTRTVKATQEQQVCVFCHTPHAANTAQAPLWNRQLSQAQYTTYNSGSFDSAGRVPADAPNGVSKLCLSCHDGTMAVGAVNVLNGTFTDQNPGTEDIAMQGTTITAGVRGTMAAGEGIATGFTRYLGVDLTNDHPISVVFDATLANLDGEMRDPSGAASNHIKVRGGAQRPTTTDIHLEPNPNGAGAGGGLVQCNSCHDPHIRDTTDENIKFLRLNRLQKAAPSAQGTFSKANDIICLACHDKSGWALSAHALPAVANEVYTPAAAAVREFPNGTQVWETACLACHDTHTVQGSRRLLREGVDGTVITSSTGYRIKQGNGNSMPAIEETCYACHSADGGTLQGQGGGQFEVPNIKTDFENLPYHMPIKSAQQPAGREVHDIGTPNPGAGGTQLGKDFVESPALMGLNNLNNRHAECTDCHNIHRVIKNRRFNGNSNNPAPGGTHLHVAPHTNIASGVLKGIWGVEPVYGAATFGSNPVSFQVKRGDPGIGASDAVTSAYVTREYQVCLKCHSNYAYGNTPPNLMAGVGRTPPGTNAMTRYTNQAMEYQSPAGDMGEPGGNHRSWHPVMQPTGRTPGVRNANANNWRAPFNGAVGTQTMYCTDCHGNNSATQNGVVPNGGENGAPWGPHGSQNRFILKGPWSGNRPGSNDGTGVPGTGSGTPNHLCFKCHAFAQYGSGNPGTVQNSGFATGGGNMCMMGGGMCMGGGMMGMNMNNLHTFHVNAVNNFRCNLCHVAIPHGWKNKVFLVNLNDVGPEGGFAAGTQVRNGPQGTGGSTYVNGPYYNRAALKVVSFGTSGQWNDNNCGSSGAPGNGAVGVMWMAGSSEACNNLP